MVNMISAILKFTWPDYYKTRLINIFRFFVITEGIMNVIVGNLYERVNSRFNNSMPWYLIGVIMVIPSFYFIMSKGVLSYLI
jgi:hypothetical protein